MRREVALEPTPWASRRPESGFADFEILDRGFALDA
jgi:hypothetical protein